MPDDPSIQNLSNIKLTNAQKRALGKGLKFVPAPPKVCKDKIKEALVRFNRRIRIAHHFSSGTTFTRKRWKLPSEWIPPYTTKHISNALSELESRVNDLPLRTPKHNLSKQDAAEIRKLQQNRTVILKPADKGSATVLMDRTHYIFEAHRQLANTKHYRTLTEPIYPQTAIRITEILEKLVKKKQLDKKQFEYLRPPDNPRPRRLYLLPKIHKEPEKWTVKGKMPPGRPIISDCGSESYGVSEFIDYYLASIGKTHPSYLKDTPHFLEELKKNRAPHDVLLITIDVDSLYTNIPIEDGIEAVHRAFQQSPDPARPVEAILELLKLSLVNNDFTFNGDWFLQTWGTAMGKRFAPHYANIFMAQWEQQALERSPLKPLFYKRFLDDIFIVWQHGRESFDAFFETLQTTHESISLKHEISETEVNFLDTTAYKGPRFIREGILDSKVYFKPTDSLQLLDKTSYHPKHTFTGIIKSQILRYKRICNNQQDVEEACYKLFKALKKRNYTKRFLRKVKNDTLHPKEKTPGLSHKCGHKKCATCQYTIDKRKIKGFNIPTTQNCAAKNGIYLISCLNCQSSYVGETGNQFRTRICQHISDIKTKKPTSVGEHFNQGRCSLITLDVTFLETLRPREEQHQNKAARLGKEREWAQKLESYTPLGMNSIPRPLENPVMPFVIPFSETAVEISKLAKDTYEYLKAIYPNSFPHRFVAAYSKNENLHTKLVSAKMKGEPKIAELNSQPTELTTDTDRESLQTLVNLLHSQEATLPEIEPIGHLDTHQQVGKPDPNPVPLDFRYWKTPVPNTRIIVRPVRYPPIINLTED